MTKEKHIQRHKELHEHLDELVADYIYFNTGRLPSSTTVMELIKWSYQQIINPEENENG